MYLHHLPDFERLENTFNNAGYKLEVDLSNSIIISDLSNDWIEYDQLPDYLKKELDKFAEDNNLN